MPRLTKILHRRDTAANWSSTNPTLDSSEIGYDTTNKMLKIGDGSTAWNSLGVMAQQGFPINGTSSISGRFILPTAASVLGTSAGLGNGRLTMVPIYIDTPCTIDRIGCATTVVSSANGVVRLGIYNHGTNAPGTLLLDAGTVQVSSGTGSKLITISQSLGVGIYWLAAVLQGAPSTNPTFVYERGASWAVPMPAVSGGEDNINCYLLTGVTGALGSVASASADQAAIHVFVRTA